MAKKKAATKQWDFVNRRDVTDEYQSFIDPLGVHIPDSISHEDACKLVAADRLYKACLAMWPIVADAIMHGMPVTPKVAKARKLAQEALAKAEGK